MIDPADLQALLGKIEGGAVAVDLLKIGQSHHQQNAPAGGKNNKYNANFRIALDIEDCLDRFYGGYYSDWACGGQWNRAYQFVQLLANAFKNAHVEIIAFFDGTLKKNKRLTFERNDFRQKTISVLKHIRMMGTPPPKIWWLPPSGIRTTLRNALRSVNIQVAQTVNDHTMEIIEYFHEQKLDGILGLHPDYIIANTSRYFSSHDLRLSYKGALETKEYMVSKLLASLSLTADHLPFVAVFLGGYILIDKDKLKSMHELLKIEGDFEARIREIAKIVRNSPTTDIDEFIKHLNLNEFENEIKESVEYYQRKGKFSGKKYLGNKKRASNDTHKPANSESAPFASETNENDEMARKILKDVNNLVDEEAIAADEKSAKDSKDNKDNKDDVTKKPTAFVYTLPGEVLKTSLNRHQRGIMDSRIYQLLTKKEIILPQILEDEQYREIPSVHLFYRPARQMIYAILFNLYHQKYLCSKRNSSAGGNDKKGDKKGKKEQVKLPEVQIAEWIWSPKNEYKKAEIVNAQFLPWAVPTIQTLWFGMAFEDKQRRMKAFLTIMRSDSPLMLNRGYVPQHMLVMACVLRYIVTSPDRNILTRQELDAFLATAFCPQLPMVEYTQDLVLPGVHLRGVYLATLFMQGVETASLANDSCGIPLPWTMTNPWLFFDGKLFHLKLKMSTLVTTLRELCDNHIEIVLKIERFRKAILEDVEHLLLPAAHIDPMYRPGFLPPPLPVAYNKNTLHSLATATSSNGTIFYNPQAPYFSLSPALLGREAITGVNPPTTTGRNGNRNAGQQRTTNNNRKAFHQLKVGGIVTGSWATGGATTRSTFGPPGNRLGNRLTNSLARLNITNRVKTSVNARLQRAQNSNQGNIAARSISRAYGTKLNARNRNRQKRKENRKGGNKKDQKDKVETSKDEVKNDNETTDEKKPVTKTEIENVTDKVKGLSVKNNVVELQNGTTALASDLANSMCDVILKEDDESSTKIKTTTENHSSSPSKTTKASAPEKCDTKQAQNESTNITTTTAKTVTAAATTTTATTVSSDNDASKVSTVSTKDTSLSEEVNESAKQIIATKTSVISGSGGGNNKSANTKKSKAKKNGTANKTATSSDINDGVEVPEMGQGDVPVKG